MNYDYEGLLYTVGLWILGILAVRVACLSSEKSKPLRKSEEIKPEDDNLGPITYNSVGILIVKNIIYLCKYNKA